MSNVLKVYIDGACRGNPGLGSYGYVVKWRTTDHYGGIVDNGEETTNNRAELTGAIEALKRIQKFDYKSTIIYSDSKYVVNGATGKNKNTKNLDLWKKLEKYNNEYYTWKHIPREQNKEADRIANEALDNHLKKLKKKNKQKEESDNESDSEEEKEEEESDSESDDEDQKVFSKKKGKQEIDDEEEGKEEKKEEKKKEEKKKEEKKKEEKKKEFSPKRIPKNIQEIMDSKHIFLPRESYRNERYRKILLEKLGVNFVQGGEKYNLQEIVLGNNVTVEKSICSLSSNTISFVVLLQIYEGRKVQVAIGTYNEDAQSFLIIFD